MKRIAGLAWLIVATGALFAQEAGQEPRDPPQGEGKARREECTRGGICLCKWKWENRPYTPARSYFVTEKFWTQVKKVCWGEIAQFECVEKPTRGAAQAKKIESPVLAKALEEAKKQGKLVLFLGMTGG